MENLIYTKIKNQEQYDQYASILYDLLMKNDIGESTQNHIDILLLLIKDWDSTTYDGKDYDPIEIINSLINDHNLKQKEFAKIIDKSESYVSEILNYKKYPSKNVIRAISEHFKVLQEALNKPYRLDLKKEEENTILMLGYLQQNKFVKGAHYITKGSTNLQQSGLKIYQLKSSKYH